MEENSSELLSRSYTLPPVGEKKAVRRLSRQQFAEYGVLALILILYAVVAWLYATETPDWQVPDEPAHYNYIRQIVENGELPVIQMGDWDSEYQLLLTSSGFDPQVTGDLHRIEYEDHQPPLYYLLQAPVYWVSDGDLVAMRLFSALIGAGVILLAWATARLLFPEQVWIGLTAAAFVAFIPQRVAMMAGVGNDALAELVAGLVLFLSTIYLRPWRPYFLQRTFLLPLFMGVAVGIAFLTKTTVYYTAGIAGLAILARAWREKWGWSFSFKQAAAFLAPALALGAIWWIHSINTYGGNDFLGLQRHDEVVIGQLKRVDYVEKELGGSDRLYWENLSKTTFHSFWGQMGWMALPMPERVYRALFWTMIVVVIGVGVDAYLSRGFKNMTPAQAETLALFDLAMVLVLAQFLIYNQTFVQFQGRYLYPALIPLALVVALGLDGWLQIPARWLPGVRWLALGVTLAMVFFAYYGVRDIISTLPTWD